MRAICLCFFAAAALLGSATGTGPLTGADQSLAYLLARTASSRPPRADPAFDCGWREFALAYAAEIQPWLTAGQQRELYDALQLQALCNVSFAGMAARMQRGTEGEQERRETLFSSPSSPASPAAAAAAADVTVYVSPAGSDDNDGSLAHPKQTLAGALAAVRAARAGRPQLTAAVLLRQGTYYLNSTLVLDARDSALTIAGYPGENATLSGGVLLQGLAWTRTAHNPSIFQAALPAAALARLPHGIRALRVDGLRATLARYPNADAEIDLFPVGYILGGQTWMPPTYRGAVCNPAQQCGVSVNVTVPVADAWHGMYQNWTVGYGGACEVYDPPYSPWCSGDFYLERQFPEMHTRHPAGLATASLPHAPYANATAAVVHAWRPGHWYTWMFEVARADFAPQQANWTVAQGQNNIYGLLPAPRTSNAAVLYLGNFSSSRECFAACNRTRGCATWTYHEPAFDPAWAFGCYSRRDGGWGPVAQASVTSAYFLNGSLANLHFGAGGTQGGEGSDTAGEWFIENVMEELDAPNEFYFDEQASQLYLWYNGSGAPPAAVVVPALAVLVHLAGSLEAPIRNVTIANVTFTANRPTFMDPRANPSGGDWALERLGALLLEGTEDSLVAGCDFVRLDSNAVFLSAYNRRARILRNRFAWLGQSAVASWGRTQYNDGTDGDQPRFTLVQGNWMHELGHYQKQSSCYFQAESAQLTFVENICFNIPRAGINVNDGFGGANEIARNLLFNTCRESSDHGAFNSWDRLPYLTDVRDGATPSTVPAPNDVHHNFIVANYAADGGCLDNDDGSAYYAIHHNFCVYGGHKSDFDGHSKTSAFNLHVYPNVYGTTCLNIGAQLLPPAGYAEQYHDNVCILPEAHDRYLLVQGIDSAAGECLGGSPAAHAAFTAGLLVANNTVYAPQGQAVVSCGGADVSFERFQQLGLDSGSTVSASMPDAATIVAWGKQLLLGEGV